MASSVKRIVILGHSFARRLEEHMATGSVPTNCNMDSSRHIVSIVHRVRQQNVRLIDDFDFNLLSSLVDDIRPTDLIVMMMGTNDLASSPGRIEEHVENLLSMADILSFTCAKRVAIMEVFPRFGPSGFSLTHTECWSMTWGCQPGKMVTHYSRRTQTRLI